MLVEASQNVVLVVGVIKGNEDRGFFAYRSVEMVAKDGTEMAASNDEVILGEIIFDFFPLLPEGEAGKSKGVFGDELFGYDMTNFEHN